MKIGKFILKIIYWTIVISLILVAILTSISTSLKIPGGIRMLIVQSGSMEPEIKTGSIVLVKEQKSYTYGDIVTFGKSEISGSTTHRIVDIKNTSGEITFITKGDANQAPDREPITRDEILGSVFIIIPYVGYAISFAKTQIGFIFLIVVPATIIIFSEFLNLKKEMLLLIQKRKSKNEATC